MGLIYNPSESGELVSNFQANLTSCEQVIADLKKGNNHLISALNSKQLSGAAFTAGQGMFTQLVIPVVSKADTVIQDIKTKLQQFSQYTAAAGGEILDEDKLNQQLEELRRQQASLTSQIHVYQNQARFSDEPDMTAMCYSYANDLSNFMGTVQDDIRKVEEKLKKLHELDMKTSSLFSEVASELANLSAVVSAIGNASFDSSGKVVFKSISAKEFVGMLSDLGSGITDPKEWLSESAGKFIDEMKDTIIKEGKNIGRSWAARLQPRSSLGTFVTDEFAPRRWLTGKLKGISNPASQVIGNVAKWGSRGLVAFGAYNSFKDYNAEYHNVGRGMVYSGVSTAASWAAGGAGVAIGTTVGAAVTSGLVGAGVIASGGLVAAGIAIAAPVAGAVVIGVAAGAVVKAAYDHVKPFRDGVNAIGDGINKIGKVVSNPLKSLKGAFGW
ncbi:hypothetical protein FACS1894192_12630 [Bacilli bacterium]|nr:hypothetical protein FACS1894192_12630 [Bacilli bacterium]GHU45318.1 hypothetical protein FACS1894194_0860 [Bacilli bacterium]